MSDNSNNIHFSGVGVIYGAYLMTECGRQINLTPSQKHCTVILTRKGFENVTEMFGFFFSSKSYILDSRGCQLFSNFCNELGVNFMC